MCAAQLELTEHVPTRFAVGALTQDQGTLLLRTYGRFFDIQFPSPRTEGRWELTPAGWVGAIVLPDGIRIISRPKVPIGNLARMLGVVYDLPVETFPGITSCATLPDLYDQLARILARSTLKILRQGLHREYLRVGRRREAIRGRIDIQRSMRVASSGQLWCRYAERTGDVIHNTVLLGTIDGIIRSGICGEATQQLLREAYRQLMGVVALRRVTAADCLSVRYDRLTDRYRLAHALCLLFLQGQGSVAEGGEAATAPFLIHMPTLFEQFVSKWLDARFQEEGSLRVSEQERNAVGIQNHIDFLIDLVIYDSTTGRPLCVLDTKYKDAATPAAGNVAQVGYYALLKGCQLAGLVFPTGAAGWEGWSGTVRTFRATFDLSGDIEAAGELFYRDLMGRVSDLRGARSATA